MLISTNHQTIFKQLDDDEVVGGTNQCLCLPKELNSKILTKRHSAILLFGWVFGVQLDSLEKSVLANAEKRRDLIPTFLPT